MSFLCRCPKCGSEFEAQDEWAGMTTTCPSCAQEFTIKNPKASPKQAVNEKFPAPAPSPKNAPNLTFRQRIRNLFLYDYPWGRIYIFCSRIIAVLVILSSLMLISKTMTAPYWEYRQKIEKHEEKIPEIVKTQQDFEKEYLRIASLIFTGNNSKAKFQFPQDLCVIGQGFNTSLNSENEIKESQKTMQIYLKKIQQISAIMNTYFSQSQKVIEKKMRKGDTITLQLGSSSKQKFHKGSISLKTGSDANFYTNDPTELLDDLPKAINFLRTMSKKSNLEIDSELVAIEDGVDFISRSLNARAKKRLVSGTSFVTGQASTQRTRQIGTKQFENEKNLLEAILTQIARLCDWNSSHRNVFIWSITQQHTQLSEVLSTFLMELQEIKARFRQNMKAAAWESCKILLAAFALAFMILIFSDFLKAHFDGAVTAKEILQKMGLFLLLPFLAIMLNGCEKTPKKLFERDQEELQRSAITEIMRSLMEQNQDAKIFVNTPASDELVIITGGMPTHTNTDRGFDIVASGRLYTVVKLKFTPISIQKSVLREEPDGKRKIMFVFQYKQVLSQSTGKGVFGLVVHSLTPENFGSLSEIRKKDWYQEQLKHIPGDDFDYYIASCRVTGEERESVTQNFTAVWNAELKKWQLDVESKPLSFSPLRSVSEGDLQKLLEKYSFKKISVRANGLTQAYWFREPDYTYADYIYQQNLVKVGNEWKSAEVVRQTRELQRAWDTWKNSHRSEDFDTLLDKIKDNPKAENRDGFIKGAEKYFLDILVGVENDLDDLRKLHDRVERDPKYQFFNKDLLLTEIDKKISRVEAAHKREIRELTDIREMYKQVQSDPKRFDKTLDKMDDSCLKYNRDYRKHKSCLQILFRILSNDTATCNEIIKKKGIVFQYQITTPCSRCRGSGRQPCGFCKNTGICPQCNGTGVHSGSKFEIVNGKFVENHYQESCPPKCNICKGQTLVCQSCKGKRIKINRAAVKDAFAKEINNICKLINDNIRKKAHILKNRD